MGIDRSHTMVHLVKKVGVASQGFSRKTAPPEECFGLMRCSGGKYIYFFFRILLREILKTFKKYRHV